MVRFTTIITDNIKMNNLLENLLLVSILISPLFCVIYSNLILNTLYQIDYKTSSIVL